MATLEQIQKFIADAKKAEKAQTLTLVTKTSTYVNKTDSSDSFNSLDEAFKKGLNLSKYELKQSKTGFKVDNKELLTAKEIEIYREYIKYVDLCNSKEVSYNVSAEFKKLKTAIDNKVNSLKADVEKQELVKEFRKEVNAAKAVIDEISFKQLLNRYNEIKKGLK